MHVSIKKTDKKGTSRPVVTISKKTAKKAVDRNLLRRRIRAIIRAADPQDPSSLLVIAKPGILDLSFKELKEEIESQIARMK